MILKCFKIFFCSFIHKYFIPDDNETTSHGNISERIELENGTFCGTKTIEYHLRFHRKSTSVTLNGISITFEI